MNIIDGIPIFGAAEENTIAQIKVCAKNAAHVALMADNHKGYAVPIGGVVAYEGAISPSGVGYDIGCGNKAVLLDVDASYVRQNIKDIMDRVWSTISFGVGRKNDDTTVEHPLFDGDGWQIDATKQLKKMASDQLGTVGSGNHYVDIFTDEKDRVWIGVHFGSRGLGHTTATWFLKAAGAKDGMDVEPCVLDEASDLGQQYILGMTLAGKYAYAGRDWVCNRVAQIMGGQIIEQVHNHHNFAWKESHFGKDLWVVRKGATPAFPSQRGFVGSTMAENAVILEGAPITSSSAVTDQMAAMFSTVHGAGRVMGRNEAAGKFKFSARWKCQNYRNCTYTAPKGGYFKAENGPTPRCPQCGHKLRLERMGEQVREGKVTHEMMDGWVKKANVELRGAGLDESPDCYKRLTDVLAAQGDTIRILHTLTPIGVAMAGANEQDPYKD